MNPEHLWSVITNEETHFEQLWVRQIFDWLSRSELQRKSLHLSFGLLHLTNTLHFFTLQLFLSGFHFFYFVYIMLLCVWQGFPFTSRSLFRVSHFLTSSLTPLPFHLCPTMDISRLLSTAPPAAVWMLARQWKPGPACWRALHFWTCPMHTDQWDTELTCLQGLQDTSQAPIIQVDSKSHSENVLPLGKESLTAQFQNNNWALDKILCGVNYFVYQNLQKLILAKKKKKSTILWIKFFESSIFLFVMRHYSAQ